MMTIVFILATIVVMVGPVFAFSSNQSAVSPRDYKPSGRQRVFLYQATPESREIQCLGDDGSGHETRIPWRRWNGELCLPLEQRQKRNVGTGEQENQRNYRKSKNCFELRFIKPFQSVASAVMTIEAAGPKETVVNWSFSSTMKMPMKLMKPMIENMLEKS